MKCTTSGIRSWEIAFGNSTDSLLWTTAEFDDQSEWQDGKVVIVHN
jgi:hypothetical protein